MIDNIKIRFNSKEPSENYLKSTGKYIQPYFFGENKNEIYPIKKKLGNIELRITEQNSVLSNSIHKFYNIKKYGDTLGSHNYNDFSYCNLLESLEYLEKDFSGLNLNDGYLQSLEFGFNLQVDKEPKYYIDNNFLLYQHKAAAINKSTNAMHYKKFEHNNIAFKIYDKKTQYRLLNNILRVEIVLGSSELKTLGIDSLNKLKDRQKILLLYTRMIQYFKGFTIVDNRFERRDLSEELINDLGNRLEPSYWKNKRGKSNIYRDKEKLKKIIFENKLNQTETYFIELIRSKFYELFYPCNFNLQVA